MKSSCERSAARYAVELVVVFLLYGAALVVSLRWLQAGVEGPLKYVAALLPVVPALGIPWVVLRYVQAMDELQQRMQLESLTFGFVAAAIATFTYGFLQNAGLPEVNWVWVVPVMCVCWVAGQLFARWRYR
jgi:hypothetical protein